MSQAFYPTNDGHIGNLTKLSTLEIRDLLKRQKDLIKKKQSILNKLPDKGARIKKHLEDFQHELDRRESELKLAKDKKRSQNKDQSVVNVASESPEQGSDNLLESELQKLSVKDDKNEVNKRLGGDDDDEDEAIEKHKHQFEVAIERAEKNLQSGWKQPIKLNRALKIEHVSDLPDDIMKMKDAMKLPENVKPHQGKMEHSQSKVTEESAAVPPNYKYSEVKMININESLQLQIKQKQMQEELNAQLAAEKLAERLHIKMEEYNPEGTDMSYRGTKGNGDIDNVDSDDDEEDAESAQYSQTMVPSDTED